MDALIRERNGLKSRIGKVLTVVNKHATHPLDLFEVNSYLEDIAKMHGKVEIIQEKMFRDHCADDNETEIQAKVSEDLDDKVRAIRKKLFAIQAVLIPTRSASHHSASDTVKLPRIEIPGFDGKYEDWASFADLFESTINSKASLSGSQKLQYLKGLVKGEAASLIKAFTITDKNYDEAWAVLQERYDNEREISNSIMKRLFNQAALTKESPKALQKLLDTTNECIRSLAVLNRPVSHWDDLLVYMTLEKMDPESRHQWALTLRGTKLPTFKRLTDFLIQRVRALNASGSCGVKAQHTEKRINGSSGGERGETSSHHSTGESKCGSCQRKGHHIRECRKFASQTQAERFNYAKGNNLCFICLESGHRSCDCTSGLKCEPCKSELHHTLLHYTKKQFKRTEAEESTVATHFSGYGSTQVLLSTALGKIEDSLGCKQVVRSLLDSGSQASFITEACVNALGLKRMRSKITISGLSSTKVGYARGKVKFNLISMVYDVIIPVEALILPKVTSTLPRVPCTQKWTHLVGLPLADPNFHRPGSIDLLLGADVVASIMREGKRIGSRNSPIAQNSELGWVLSGRVNSSSGPVIQVHHAHCEAELALKRFWEIEELPQDRRFTEEEKICESHFMENHIRDAEGRFFVRIPYKLPLSSLGASRDMAISRLKQVERRLARQPEYSKQYLEFMREYEVLGHMEEVTLQEKHEKDSYYLPHHYVTKKDSTTTKLRVVFDGSAKTTTGISLNDCQMVGPTIQDNLYIRLLRFMCHIVALKGDIAKMYRKFNLFPEDLNYHRIVWRESPGLPIKDFRLKTLTYGTSSAAFLATRCLKQLADDERSKFPSAAAALEREMYVDDYLGGESTEKRAIALQKELCELVKSGGMELRKWTSSSAAVRQAIPSELLEEEEGLSFDTDSTIKALGVKWFPASDNFAFKVVVPENHKPVTKRILLSELAKVFDPLGWLSPTTVRAKVMFQTLWKLTIGWDEELPKQHQDEWIQYQAELPSIQIVQVPRCIVIQEFQRQELHGFCDASQLAYAAVLYLRTIRSDGSVVVRLITAKTKVAPMKQVSLPRLELCGAVMLAKLVKTAKEATGTKAEVILWTDSTIVLRWLASCSRDLKTFVANRVSEIQDSFPVTNWRHVPGVENPADCASRGLLANELVNFSLWWKGPKWLLATTLPSFPTIDNMEKMDLEKRKKTEFVAQAVTHPCLFSRFSNLGKLKYTFACWMRFTNNARKKPEERTTGQVSCEELKSALFLLIKIAQDTEFSSEIKCLKENLPLSSKSKILTLAPFIDLRGVLRVGGRLGSANLPVMEKHQVILPHPHPLTKLIIQECHLNNLHAGFQLLWTTLRREYWILRARDTIRHLVRRCVICRKVRAETAEQLMGSLPSARVNPGRPFDHCGVDYAGPFLTSVMKIKSTKTFKSYFCIFVCLATKAVHLEAVSDLSTEAFIASFRRFAARRGISSHLYSDCGTNFVGANRELKEMLESARHNALMAHQLSKQGTTWHFNAPAAPHQGGLWEAGVKSTKHHLKRVVGDHRLTFEEFQTLLCQVEACMNSRPLCALSPDPADYDALTPGHFLIGSALNAIPEGDLQDVKFNRLSRWEKVQQMLQHWWKRWRLEYLSGLQQRFKWTAKRDNLEVGDLVIIKEDNLPPTKWRMGRITMTHPGSDSCVRRATVKTADGELLRPVVKLCPILFNHES